MFIKDLLCMLFRQATFMQFIPLFILTIYLEKFFKFLYFLVTLYLPVLGAPSK